MRKKKELVDKQLTTADTENTVLEVPKVEIKDQKPEISEDLEKRFKDFDNSDSEFKPEQQESTPLNMVTGNPSKPQEPRQPTAEELIKIQMFLGLCSYVLAGFNHFILNYLRKSKVPYDKLLLTDDEILQFVPYVSTEQIIVMLSKIPGWLIGFVHYEYMAFKKHSLYVDEYKIKKQDKPIQRKQK